MIAEDEYELATEIPEAQQDQIKQIEGAIAHERLQSSMGDFPFKFVNGLIVYEASDAGLSRTLSPSEMIKEELRLREQRGELTHDKSPLLIKLTSLYRVTVFETKPQMFPQSSVQSLPQVIPENFNDMSKDITLDDIRGFMHQSNRLSEMSQSDRNTA